jgi:hypothetical protein
MCAGFGLSSFVRIGLSNFYNWLYSTGWIALK